MGRVLMRESKVDRSQVSESGGEQPFAPLVDVSELPLLAVAVGEQTALGRSLHQVMRSLDDPNGVISAFDSFANGG
jgi:FXSXX-COOH protein